MNEIISYPDRLNRNKAEFDARKNDAIREYKGLVGLARTKEVDVLQVLSNRNPQKHQIVLAGCGSGPAVAAFFESMKQQGLEITVEEVVCIDIDQSAINATSHKFPGIQSHVISMNNYLDQFFSLYPDKQIIAAFGLYVPAQGVIVPIAHEMAQEVDDPERQQIFTPNALVLFSTAQAHPSVDPDAIDDIGDFIEWRDPWLKKWEGKNEKLRVCTALLNYDGSYGETNDYIISK